jgi:hypothetical protein
MSRKSYSSFVRACAVTAGIDTTREPLPIHTLLQAASLFDEIFEAARLLPGVRGV